jgi:hypothetical protein
MKASEILNSAWSAIAADVKTEHGWYQRRLSIAAPGELHAAILHPGNLRRISIQIPRPLLPSLAVYEDTRGFQLQIDTDSPAAPTVTAHLRESASTSRELFSLLTADLLDHYRLGDTIEMCISRFWQRLLAWKRFFQTLHCGAISRETYVGLFGELTCLNDLLDAGLSGAPLLRTWSGPAGTPQDFSAGPTAVEVKTSVGANPSTVRVSGPSQLDDSALASLFLYHVVADFRTGTGIRLSTLIDATIERLGSESEAAVLLRDNLLASGLTLPDTTPWAGHGFTTLRKEVFRVSEGFPRLTPAHLPAGVVEVAYEVELSACQPFRRIVADMTKALKAEVHHA